MQLVGKPVFVTHGLYDSVLPIDQGRAIQAELKRYPVLMTYKEYPMGHEVSPQSIADIQTFLTNLLDDEKRHKTSSGLQPLFGVTLS